MGGPRDADSAGVEARARQDVVIVMVSPRARVWSAMKHGESTGLRRLAAQTSRSQGRYTSSRGGRRGSPHDLAQPARLKTGLAYLRSACLCVSMTEPYV